MVIDRPQIEDVFVPRGDFSDQNIYIPRKKYDDVLASCMKTKTNIFISGESGSGKTWLYEIFFATRKINFIVINLAEIIMYDSLFCMLEKKILGSSGKIVKNEILDVCYSKLNEKNHTQRNPSFIVFDNLEHLESIGIDPRYKNELILLIHSLDNRELSAYNIRYLLVGIPSSLKEFFSGMSILFEPIANRIREVPTLDGFEVSELNEFLRKTLVEKLFFHISNSSLKEISEYIQKVTDLIPLRVQQFLFYLAHEIMNNCKKYEKELLYESSKKWIYAHYSEVEIVFDEHFLTPTSRVKKTNQVIFLLGKIDTSNIFTNQDLIGLYRKYFPTTFKKGTINMSMIFSGLSKGNKPILKKINNRDKFRLVDSRLKILINSRLFIGEKEVIYKK